MLQRMVAERDDLILSNGGEEYNNRHVHTLRVLLVRTCGTLFGSAEGIDNRQSLTKVVRYGG